MNTVTYSLKEIYETLVGLNFWSITFRLLLATLMGGCIGFERGKHGRAAGLRTYILVCVGSSVTVLVGLYATQYLECSSDPMRISSQVVSGVGFLGAGTILHHNHTHVSGLTTAAGLWTTASIGLAIGIGAYWVAVLAFIIMMITVVLLIHMERASKKTTSNSYYLELEDISCVNTLFQELTDEEYTLQIIPAKSGLVPHVGIMLTVTSIFDEKELLERFSKYNHILAAISVIA